MRSALAEDIGPGDITANLTPAGARASASVTIREAAVLCGRDWFEQAIRQLDASSSFQWHYQDGDMVPADTVVCQIEASVRALLTGERTALNFLQTLSATATSARRFVDAVAGTGAIVLDTRKTIPGLRAAQKYAVRVGGASNHRIGLFDAILIKENHIAAMGSIESAIEAARSAATDVLIEVEVETIQQVPAALASAADRLLLDNFSADAMRAAVALRDRVVPRKKLEASGGITLDNVREIAEIGVDYISVGAMTKTVQAVDFSLRIV